MKQIASATFSGRISRFNCVNGRMPQSVLNQVDKLIQ